MTNMSKASATTTSYIDGVAQKSRLPSIEESKLPCQTDFNSFARQPQSSWPAV